MQEIKISNGYIQLWATYLRSLQIEPLEADFLQDVHEALVPLIDQPFATQVPLEFIKSASVKNPATFKLSTTNFRDRAGYSSRTFWRARLYGFAKQQRCGNDPPYYAFSTTGD